MNNGDLGYSSAIIRLTNFFLLLLREKLIEQPRHFSQSRFEFNQHSFVVRLLFADLFADLVILAHGRYVDL